MSQKVILLFFTFILHKSSSEGFLPSYIKPCDQDNNFEECVKKQIAEVLPLFTRGIPELDVPPIDPVNLEDIHINGNNLNLVLSQAKMYGLNTAKLTDFKVNLKENNFVLSFKCNIIVKSQYVMDGQILILPIKGEGDATVDARNIEVKISSKLSHYKDTKNGEHFKLTSPNYTYDIEKTIFKFNNLFNGNKALSDATHRFANDNWRQIMDDLAPSAVRQIVKTTIKAINKFFSKVNLDQIILNYHSY